MSAQASPAPYLYICMRTYKNTLITAGAGGTRAACWAAGGSRGAAFCLSAKAKGSLAATEDRHCLRCAL